MRRLRTLGAIAAALVVMSMSALVTQAPADGQVDPRFRVNCRNSLVIPTIECFAFTPGVQSTRTWRVNGVPRPESDGLTFHRITNCWPGSTYRVEMSIVSDFRVRTAATRIRCPLTTR